MEDKIDNIDILEEYLDKQDRKYVSEYRLMILKAIETLISENKELKDKNKSLEQENREIRDWKYVIDSPIDLDKLKELDLIKIKGKEYISVDKIKAKIEEINEEMLNEENSLELFYRKKYCKEVLQSLLGKE